MSIRQTHEIIVDAAKLLHNVLSHRRHIEHHGGLQHGLRVDGRIDGAVFGAWMNMVGTFMPMHKVRQQPTPSLEFFHHLMGVREHPAGIIGRHDTDRILCGSSRGQHKHPSGRNRFKGSLLDVGTISHKAGIDGITARDFGIGSKECVGIPSHRWNLDTEKEA